MKYCNTCGATIRDKARKCPNCGFKGKKRTKYNAEFSEKTIDLSEKPIKSKSMTMESELSNTRKAIAAFFTVFMFFIPGIGLAIAGGRNRGFYLFTSFIIVINIDVLVKIYAQSYWVMIFTMPAYLALIIMSIVWTVKQLKRETLQKASK